MLGAPAIPPIITIGVWRAGHQRRHLKEGTDLPGIEGAESPNIRIDKHIARRVRWVSHGYSEPGRGHSQVSLRLSSYFTGTGS